MPKIINAYSDANNSIADSLKSIGQSIWGDEAKNEGLRQNAEKVRRENAGRQGASEAFRRGDLNELGAQGILGGMSAGDASGYGLYGQANRYGAQDPRTTNSWVGAGHPYAGSYHGFEEGEANKRAMEQDRTDAAKYSPIMSEDPRTGVKSLAGTLNTRTGEYRASGAQPQGGFNQPMSAPGGPQGGGFTPAASVVDDYGNPMSIPSAPLQLMHSVDENGQPILGEQGKQRLMQLEQQAPGYGSQLLGTILGHTPAPSSRSKQNTQFMRDLSSVYPNYDAGVANMRNKTYQDLATSGKTGQITTALEQGINHMGEQLIPQSAALNTWHSGSWGPLTSTMNDIYTAKLAGNQDPRLIGFNVAKEGFANEFAKIFRTTGMSEQDIEHQRQNFAAAQSPEEVQAVVRTAIGLMHGSLNAREASIKRVLGPDAQRAPMVSPETADKVAQIEQWANGGALPHFGKGGGQMTQGAPAPGGGNQPATALPPGPTGHPPSINDPPQGAQPPAAPAAAAPQAPAAAPAARPRAQNAQGHVIEWNGQAWVPTQ